MIAFPTIPSPVRRPLFYGAATLDIALRCWSATLQAEYLSYTSGVHSVSEFTSIASASGVSVPMLAVPLILSPIAYFAGQLLVVVGSNYIRLVSALFVVTSFLVYTVSPGFSVFTAMLAYLTLLSGTLTE